MDNNAYSSYPNEYSQNTKPLMEMTPENGAYQSQNGTYYQSQPPETIPIGSSDFPPYQIYDTNQNNNNMNEIKIKEQDYENFKNKALINKYHVKQPTQNTFHISTGDKWLPLIIVVVLILFVLFIVSAATGNAQVDGEAGLAILFSPCIIIILIVFCLKQFCCTYYNADITMLDNSLIIKRRSCIWRSTKIYLPGQINGIELYNHYNGKRNIYKLDINLSNNRRENLLVLTTDLTSDEVDYFNKVVNDHIKNKMKI